MMNKSNVYRFSLNVRMGYLCISINSVVPTGTSIQV